MIAAAAIAYLFVGAELAAYTYGFDEAASTFGPPSFTPTPWYEVAFIACLWPVCLAASVWRGSNGGDE